ncbi:MAG: lysophospholipid acyltransferase family protein [Sphingomicrobium sp.]
MTRLGLLLLAYVVPHLISQWLRGRSPWPYRFLRSAARIAGADVRVVGPKPKPHSLLLSNHVSWMDILVLSSATGCAFVSKDRLGHPLIHWLADQNRTIYVDRAARKAVGSQVDTIRAALARRQPVALFPEGTTGPGDHLLPFRSALLGAVAPLPEGAWVQPVAIDYGPLHREIAWFHEPALHNILRVLGRKGRFHVTVRLLEHLPSANDRKVLAHLARERIAASLHASSSNPHRL